MYVAFDQTIDVEESAKLLSFKVGIFGKSSYPPRLASTDELSKFPQVAKLMSENEGKEYCFCL